MTKSEFSEFLKKSRKEQGKTQTQCAVYAGVCLEAYQKWERGLSFPKKDKYKKICDFLGKKTDEED